MKCLKQLSTVMQVKNRNGKVKIKYVTSLLAGYTVLSTQIHFTYLEICNSAFHQGKPEDQFLDTEARRT